MSASVFLLALSVGTRSYVSLTVDAGRIHFQSGGAARFFEFVLGYMLGMRLKT